MLSLSADNLLPARETLHLAGGASGAVWFCDSLPLQRRAHRHDELELNLVTRGAATYLLGERRHDIRRGSLLWLFPEQDHVLINHTPDFAMWIAVWTPELVQRICVSAWDAPLAQKIASPEDCVRRMGETDWGRLDGLLAQIAASGSENDEASARRERVNAGLTWLLLAAWDAHQAARASAPAGRTIHPAVEQAARLLRDETEPLPLEEIARRVGLSAGRLGRLFHGQTGQTIPAFRNRQRIERYLRLRRGGARSCLEAALAAGFGSYAQFHRVFKESEHCRPGDYRD